MTTKITSKRIAEATLIIKNILSGFFPVITLLAYSNNMLPLSTLGWSSVIATLFFAIIITCKKQWRENIFNFNALKDIFWSILLIAILLHTLYFFSLQHTSAQNYSLLTLMEVPFSFIIVGMILKKEPISLKHFFGAALMFLSAFVILFNQNIAFNTGDFLILIAAAIAPIGNIFTKKAVHQVSMFYLLFLRSFTGIIIFFTLSYFFEDNVSWDIIIKSIPYLLFSGIFYFGIMKMSFLFGVKKTSVTHALSFQSLKPAATFLFAWLLLGEAPTNIQIFSLIPIFMGLYLLTTAKQKELNYNLSKR